MIALLARLVHSFFRLCAITQAVCNVFKTDVLKGSINFTAAADVIKFAMYSSAATLDKTTVAAA